MPDPIKSEIDQWLREKASKPPEVIQEQTQESQRAELIQQLQTAADRIGHSPSVREFDELDLAASSDSIRNAFESWNQAKAAAGLKQLDRHSKRPRTAVDESYFKNLDSPAKAYWFGTLLARSTIKSPGGGSGKQLSLARGGHRRYFVVEFAEAIESGYAISVSENDGQYNIQTSISNNTFINYLLALGYPSCEEACDEFPTVLGEYRTPFVRGFLESSGYFSTGGWNVKLETEQKAKTLQSWFEGFGAKRPTITAHEDGSATVRVANVFDIRAIYDSCWPEQTETTPSFTPYAKKIREHLEENHPYPENVSYL